MPSEIIICELRDFINSLTSQLWNSISGKSFSSCYPRFIFSLLGAGDFLIRIQDLFPALPGESWVARYLTRISFIWDHRSLYTCTLWSRLFCQMHGKQLPKGFYFICWWQLQPGCCFLQFESYSKNIFPKLIYGCWPAVLSLFQFTTFLPCPGIQ